MVLEEEVIPSDLKDVPNAVAILMGFLFALNIDYPRELRYIFEVIPKGPHEHWWRTVFLTCAWFKK